MADWNKVKQGYENGLTDAELAEQFGINKATVRVHRNRAKWGPANHAKRLRAKRNVTKSVTSKRNVTKKRNVTFDLENTIASADGLSDQQRLFCLYYYQLGNATRAYIKAYDCSYDSAKVSAFHLLTNPNINKYIDDLKKRFASKQVKTTQDMIDILINQATSDIGEYIDFKKVKTIRKDSNGEPKLDADEKPIIDVNTEVWLKDKDKMDLTLVNEIHEGRDGVVLKLYDKQKAVFKLMEMLPEPVNDAPNENTFINALKMSKKVFSEHEQSSENVDETDAKNENSDK